MNSTVEKEEIKSIEEEKPEKFFITNQSTMMKDTTMHLDETKLKQ